MKNTKAEKPPIKRVQATYETGLTKQEVDERIRKGYVNVTQDPNQKNMAQIVANNLFTFFNIVLFTIAFVFIGFMIYLNAIGRSDIVNSYFGFSKFVFLIPAIMNVGMGSFQEFQSMKTIQKLKIVTSTKSKVVRDGNIESLDATEIVLDDVVALSAGEQATADLIVLNGEVEVDESMLTGESDHIKKVAGDTILSGSSIIVGSARCRADKIGDDTYAAELTRKVKNTSGHKSELMSSIMKIIKVLTVCLCFAIITATVTLAVKITATGNDPTIWNGLTLSLNDPVTWSLIVLTDGMFGVGMIPSGLVLTTSVALMVSIAGLTKKQTLVQELYSLENLSRVDVICLDKTGTLTDGTMSVCEIKKFDDSAEKHIRVLMGATDERNATSEAVFQYFGADQSADIRELIPFSSANKYSGIVYNNGQKLLMGAPEYLLPKDDERLDYVIERAKEGNRVIAVKLDDTLIAFIAIEDHIRETAADTLRFFRENGVTVKVISGDNPLTVSMIAQKCGIVNADKYISLAGVPLEEIPSIAEEYTVFAREHRVFLRDGGDLLKRNTGEGDVFVGVHNAAFLRDHADGQGVITRDDLDGYAVFTEEAERIRRGLADVIFDRDKGDQRVVELYGDDAVAFFGAFDDIVKSFIVLGQQIFGRAHQQLLTVVIYDTGVFVGAGEGDQLANVGGLIGAEVLKHRFTCRVSFIGRAHQHTDVLLGAVVKFLDLTYRHRAVGQRTGFVQTDHVDAREVLKRVQLLHQRLLFGQSGDGHHQRDRGGQHQTRGDHTDAEHAVRQHDQRPCDRVVER